MWDSAEKNPDGETLVLRYRGSFHLFALVLMVFTTGTLAFSSRLPESSRTTRAYLLGFGLLCGVCAVLSILRSRTRILVDPQGVSISRPLARRLHIPWNEVRRVVGDSSLSGFVIEDRGGKKIHVSVFLRNIEGLASILLGVRETKNAQARKTLEKIAKGELTGRRFLLLATFACTFAGVLAGMATYVESSNDKETVRAPNAEELRLVIQTEDLDAPWFDANDFQTTCTVAHTNGRRLAVRYECHSEAQGWAIVSETIICSRKSSARAAYRGFCKDPFLIHFLEKQDARGLRPVPTLDEEDWPLRKIEGKAFGVRSKDRRIGSLAIACSGRSVHFAFIREPGRTLEELAALMAERLERAQAIKP